jgi:HlyD family secretion protein
MVQVCAWKPIVYQLETSCSSLPTQRQVLRAITTDMTSRLKILALAVTLAIALAAAAWWFTRPVQVAGVTAQMAPMVRTLQFSARVSASSRIDIGSTLTGRVAQVHVSEGVDLKKGTLLISLEDEELTAALMQAQANERVAAAKLAGMQSTGRSAVQSAVEQTRSVLKAAQADFQRTKALVDKGFLSDARLDEAQRAVAVAQAQVKSAEAQALANTDQGTDIAQARAQLSQAQSATTAAKARLLQAKLSAPADAKVLTRLVEPGQIVQPGRVLMNLATPNATQLIALVDERYLAQLQTGQPASVMADAFPGQRFAAQVKSISPLVDAQRGAVEVKFSITGASPAYLREDMTLSVEVETAKRERALVLPLQALRNEGANNATVVWIDEAGKVVSRPVKVGLSTLSAVEILTGLKEGDVVILGASPKPGSKVRVAIDPNALEKLSKGDPSPGGGDASAAMTNAMGR